MEVGQIEFVATAIATKAPHADAILRGIAFAARIFATFLPMLDSLLGPSKVEGVGKEEVVVALTTAESQDRCPFASELLLEMF